jgi:hypothetical protein
MAKNSIGHCLCGHEVMLPDRFCAECIVSRGRSTKHVQERFEEARYKAETDRHLTEMLGRSPVYGKLMLFHMLQELKDSKPKRKKQTQPKSVQAPVGAFNVVAQQAMVQAIMHLREQELARSIPQKLRDMV